MKLRGTLAALFSLFSLQASAQWVNDSVTMGPGYTNDVFYSLKNGTQKIQPNTDWTMAFQMTLPGPYGFVSVLANHVMGTVKVYSLHLQASVKYAGLTAADTVGKTGQQLYNSDTSWNFGAFNRNAAAGNLVDYGWGLYDQNTHNLTGDSVYLMKVGAAGTPYKVWIQQYISNPVDSIRWQFRIAQLDGTGDTTIIMRHNAYSTRLFGYYNATTRTTSDREPDRSTWDMIFTRYVDTASQGSVTLPYNTTGVLSNFGVTVADVRGLVNGDSSYFRSYPRTTKFNAIGYDWKTFNMSTNLYQVDTTINYFIKTSNTNEYYQLEFTRFDGSATGKAIFRKRLLAATAVSDVTAAGIVAWSIAPNPANDHVEVMVDSKATATNAQLMLVDASGKIVQQFAAPLQIGMNGFSVATSALPSGLYFVHLTNGTWNAAARIVVAH